MPEWHIFIDGRYAGKVFAKSETSARCAAVSQYAIPAKIAFDVRKPSGYAIELAYQLHQSDKKDSLLKKLLAKHNRVSKAKESRNAKRKRRP